MLDLALARHSVVDPGQQMRNCQCSKRVAKPDSDWYREVVKRNEKTRDMANYADMFAAIGAEPRLQIMRLLLAAHPNGLVVGDILAELKIAPSTLSHHLEKLKMEGLVDVRRDARRRLARVGQ